jgi:hypothetical protein
LAANAARSSRERLTLMRLFEELRGLGYSGGYDAVRRYAARWRRQQSAATAAFVPLSFAPGEAYQFDWSHEIVVLKGVTTIVKVAHLRLCHSRMPFVRAYPRESQEMVFDGHDRAFAFFKGTCTRGLLQGILAPEEQHLLMCAGEFSRGVLDQPLGHPGLLAHRRRQGGARRPDQRGPCDRFGAVGVAVAEEPEAVARDQEVDELTPAVDGRLIQAHSAGSARGSNDCRGRPRARSSGGALPGW